MRISAPTLVVLSMTGTASPESASRPFGRQWQARQAKKVERLEELGLPIFPGLTPRNPYRDCDRPWWWRPTEDDKEFYIDDRQTVVDDGWRIANFIETRCRHTVGRWRGGRFRLLPFQLALVLNTFGPKDPQTGLRIVRNVFAEWSKKNGKSELGAAIALALLFADREGAPHIYGCAATREQAGLIFRAAATMVRLDPDGMGARTRVLPSVKRLAVPETEGFYQALSADAGGADGVIPSGVLSDEVHRQKKRDLYDLLEGGTEPRDQPLTVNLTTTGKDGDSQLYDGLHGHAVAVQSGLVVDPTWYVDVRNLPKVDRIGEKVDWRSQRYWFVSNPALGSAKEIAEGEAFKPAERLKERVKRIESDPSSETFVRRYHLGQSIDDLDSWLPMVKWDQSGNHPLHPESKVLARRKWKAIGLDLSAVADLTAAVAIVVDDETPEGVDVVCRFWLPGSNLAEREAADSAPYGQWAKNPLTGLTLCDGDEIDEEMVEAGILRLAEDLGISTVAMDPWHGTRVAVNLERAGLTVVKVPQTAAHLDQPTRKLESLVLGGRFRVCGNPIMRYCAEGTVLDSGADGMVKPSKKKAKRRIDGIAAAINAIDAAICRQVVKPKSVYAEGGDLMIV